MIFKIFNIHDFLKLINIFFKMEEKLIRFKQVTIAIDKLIYSIIFPFK